MLTIADVLVFLISKGPGRTEEQLAVAIFGGAGYQQRVNRDCRFLVAQGKVERRGSRVLSDPYRYFVVYPVSEATHA